MNGVSKSTQLGARESRHALPAPVPPVPPPERLPLCDGALVNRVAAGTAPLGELWTSLCDERDKARVILTARTKPSLTGFVTARRRGTAVAPSLFDDNSSTRVSWEGTCVAPVVEMLPPSNGLMPTQCLADAKVSEQDLPPELNDVRAEFLFSHPTALRRWRSCREQTPAETCLDRLLPSTGGGSERDPGRAGWIAARNRARKNVGAVRRARCRLVMLDRDSGMLAFRCQGTLTDAACRGDDGGVRAALSAPADRFATARADALAACAPDDATKGRAEPFDEQALDAGAREMIHRLLARQEALFGPVPLPPNGRARSRRAATAITISIIQQSMGNVGPSATEGGEATTTNGTWFAFRPPPRRAL